MAYFYLYGGNFMKIVSRLFNYQSNEPHILHISFQISKYLQFILNNLNFIFICVLQEKMEIESNFFHSTVSI